MKEILLSFHGKQEIKDAKIADLKLHQELDNIRQGSYWNGALKKGCAVTCTMFTPKDFEKGEIDESNIHVRYETQLGIPRIIARLEDRFFEGMPVAESKNWPLAFMQAIPVGVNLESVWRKFMIWMLIDDAEGVVKFAKNDKTREAIINVANAFTRSLTTTVSRQEWIDLRAYAAYADAAYAYAAYAAAAYADAAAYAYAADAAAAAAYAADAAAAAAAAAAAYAADAAAAAAYAADAADAAAYARTSARQLHFIKMSNKLIELLQEAA